MRRTLFALLTFSSSTASAQRLIEIPKTETFKIASKAVGDSFVIRVMVPPTIPGETTRFPVVYMTDVHGGFLISEDEMRLMMISDVPRFIAVGIGYASASNYPEGLWIRARDLTHVEGKDDEDDGPPMFANTAIPSVESGGGGKFLSFIRDELMPSIDQRFPTDPKERCYWGHSLGGLFGTYVLFTKPETFNRYILASPSLWWANEDVMDLAEKYLATHDDLRANVFLSVGDPEEDFPYKMTTNVLRLERMLRAKKLPGLSLTTHVFADEQHVPVAPMSLIRGLVAVFGPPTPENSLMGKYAAMSKN